MSLTSPGVHAVLSSSGKARVVARRLGRCFMMLCLAGCLVGCTAEPAALDPLPFGSCACQEAADGACPTAVCDLRVEVDQATCSSEVGVVEVLIAGQLEQNIWKPGQKARTCATIARGSKALFVARADTAWQWREEITCPAPDGTLEKTGPTVVRILHCTTAP